MIGQHNSPRAWGSERLTIGGVEGAMDIDLLPRVWRRDQCRFHGLGFERLAHRPKARLPPWQM